MTESEAYLDLFLILGILLTLPFIWRLFTALGEAFVVKFFPPKTITFEIKLASGKTTTKKVNLENDKELIDTILSQNGRVIS